MLLIGLRKDSNTGKYWFLLQNWWKGRFFIEVEGDYFADSYASIVFVSEENKDNFLLLSPTIPTINNAYAWTWVVKQ